MQPRTPRPIENTSNPFDHTHQISARFSELIDHLRQDIERVNEPQFRAMCETAAEVIGGLRTAFSHYEQQSEEAWKNQTPRS
jgi:hypothetical protein